MAAQTSSRSLTSPQKLLNFFSSVYLLKGKVQPIFKFKEQRLSREAVAPSYYCIKFSLKLCRADVLVEFMQGFMNPGLERTSSANT